MNISKLLKVTSVLIAIFGAYTGCQLGNALVLPSQKFNYIVSISIWVASFIVFITMFAFGDFVQMQHEIHEEIIRSNKLLSRIIDKETEKELNNPYSSRGVVKLEIDDE